MRPSTSPLVKCRISDPCAIVRLFHSVHEQQAITCNIDINLMVDDLIAAETRACQLAAAAATAAAAAASGRACTASPQMRSVACVNPRPTSPSPAPVHRCSTRMHHSQ